MRDGDSTTSALARASRWLFALLVGALLVALAPVGSSRQAVAASTAVCGADVLGIAQQFNVFVQHDYSVSNTDVKGRAAAGGNVSINSYAVGVDLPPDSGRDDLIVGGDLTAGGGGAQAPHGSVTHGGALSGTISTPNGTLTHAAPPFDITAQFSQLVSQSKAIGALAPNGTAGGPSYAFELVGTNAVTNVFTIAASALQGAQVIEIKVPAGSSTVVNVTGSAYSTARFPTAAIKFWDGSQYVQISDPAPPVLEALRSSLLWNFPDATSVQIGPNLAWEGTVLAPLAAVTFPGSTQLNGSLIAGTLVNSSGSARNHPYMGCVHGHAASPGSSGSRRPLRDPATGSTARRRPGCARKRHDSRRVDARPPRSSPGLRMGRSRSRPTARSPMSLPRASPAATASRTTCGKARPCRTSRP